MSKFKSRQMTLQYNSAVEQLMKELAEFFNVGTKAETIRRSLALTRSLANYADRDGNITLYEPGTDNTVLLIT